MTRRREITYSELERKPEERTRELPKSLEQQAATSEILRVISSGLGDLSAPSAPLAPGRLSPGREE